MSNRTAIASTLSNRESLTATSMMPLSMAISEHSLIQDVPGFIEELRTSYQPVSRASHLAEQEKNKAKKMPGINGRKRQNASRLFDHKQFNWRTSQGLLQMGISTQCLVTWPVSGMTLGMMFYPLPPMVPTIYGKDCGLLPTPVASDWKRQGVTLETAQRYVANGRGAPLPLKLTLLTGSTGIPNPRFYESMMGWPLGWTELKPLEMVSIQEWQRGHGLI